MAERDRTDTLTRTGAKRLLVLAPAAAYLLVGALSRLFGRREDPRAQVERAVREVREEMGRGREPVSRLPEPTQKEVLKRQWERRRREAEEAST